MRCETNGKKTVFMVVYDLESSLPRQPYEANSVDELLESLQRSDPATASRVKDVYLIN